jgi:hypothetical protein
MNYLRDSLILLDSYKNGKQVLLLNVYSKIALVINRKLEEIFGVCKINIEPKGRELRQVFSPCNVKKFRVRLLEQANSLNYNEKFRDALLKLISNLF